MDSGGIKETQRYQEDPMLNKCVRLMAEVSKKVDERITVRSIIIKGYKFIGNLDFTEE